MMALRTASLEPPACHVDLKPIECQQGTSDNCLSAKQISAVKKIYGGPVNSKGERIYESTLPGTEGKGRVGVLGFDAISQVSTITTMFQNMAFYPPGPGFRWNYNDFDHDRDWQRLDLMRVVYGDGGIPDLRKFKAAGGKLIINHSWGDGGSTNPLKSVDLYESVEKLMGGRSQTQDFFRLFMMPGRNHCVGGPGAHAFDVVTPMEKWVQTGESPDMLVGAHLESAAESALFPDIYFGYDAQKADFTRPVYPYPLRAVYKGQGDATDWRNYKPVDGSVNWVNYREWQDNLRNRP